MDNVGQRPNYNNKLLPPLFWLQQGHFIVHGV